MGLAINRAEVIFLNKQVTLIKETEDRIYLQVRDYEVTFDKRKNYWNCLCIHGSSFRNEKQICCHIKAAIMWRENGRTTKNDSRAVKNPG
jgi:hypothetical protein